MTLARRNQAEEAMDAPDLDPRIYAQVLRDLARVNRVTLAARPTLQFLRRATGRDRRLKLLDVGFGDGDMLRRIARWGERSGVALDLTGIDLNPRSASIAQADTPAAMNIRYLTGDYASLAGQQWDVIVSSLVAHHMQHPELVAFVRFMEAEAKRGWFINDLHRHRFAYAGYPVLAAAMRWHPIVRADGRLSIARSYRPGEWRPILAEAEASDVRIQRYFPFRLCVSKLH